MCECIGFCLCLAASAFISYYTVEECLYCKRIDTDYV